MRKELEPFEGRKLLFRRTVTRFGKNKFGGIYKTCFMLIDVHSVEYPEATAQHVWLSFTKKFKQEDLRLGDVVEFYATVKRYRKGKDKNVEDFKLAWPSGIKIRNQNKNYARRVVSPEKHIIRRRKGCDDVRTVIPEKTVREYVPFKPPTIISLPD